MDEFEALTSELEADVEPIATHKCMWCGSTVPEDDDCPMPSDYCHHPVVMPRATDFSADWS